MLDFEGKKRITGIGSALMDLLIDESDNFVAGLNARKGGMTLVDIDFITDVMVRASGMPTLVPGGSACNTIIGVGQLGGPARFIGKCGEDDLGNQLEEALKKSKVEPVLGRTDLPTGRVLSIITPDAQRTMFTYLGASSEQLPVEVAAHSYKDTAIVHIEGYLLFNKELITAAMKAAKAAGAKISLDLASFTVVEAAREYLLELVKEYVDILLANEDEAAAFTGIREEEEALKILSSHAEVAALKVGAKGAYVVCDGEIYRVPPVAAPPQEIIDTTGAGDLWASGFLYSLVNGLPPEHCGLLASHCGYEVCKVIGAHIPDDGWQRIRTVLNQHYPNH